MTKINEIWKAIPNCDGIYEISNLGRIKKPAQTYKSGWSRQEKITFGDISKRGYKTIGLFQGGKYKIRYIHRLVAEAFVRNPENQKDVNHINGIKSDNRAENLEWVNQRENKSHSLLNNKSEKLTGVCYRPKQILRPWEAKIHLNGKTQYLGIFKTQQEASEAYQRALKENSLTNKYSKK
jgi:hypothetical protein